MLYFLKEDLNVNKLKHANTPPFRSSKSTPIIFIFVFTATAKYVYRCGILNYNIILSSQYITLYIDIDILRLLGYPVHGTVRALEFDLQLNEPTPINVDQATLFHQIHNHNVERRVDALYEVDTPVWATHHETHFNSINRGVERAMHCAATNCRCKSFKKHKWTVTFTQIIIYEIRFW
jgi:hypothetical protein